jgi:hypothetical protein
VAVTAVSFATPDDLNNYLLGSGGTAVNVDRAQQVLNQATADIQSWTHQNLFPVAAETVTVDPFDTGSVYLPELPVTGVSTVEYLDGSNVWQTLDPSYYRWNGKRGQVYLIARAPYWPWQLDTIRVTYDHGYATIPNDLAGLCVRLAARQVANPYDAQSMVTGGIQMRFSGTRGTDGLKDTELAILGKYSLVEVS